MDNSIKPNKDFYISSFALLNNFIFIVKNVLININTICIHGEIYEK